MKVNLSLILFISALHLFTYTNGVIASTSDGVECLNQYHQIMTPEEKRLQQELPDIFNMFLTCPLSIENLSTAVHESMHIKDLDALNLIQKYSDNPELASKVDLTIFKNVKIHTIDNQVFSIPYLEITAPNEVFQNPKNRHISTAGKMTNIFFNDFLDIYTDRIDSQGETNTNLSTYSFGIGFLMELNGYIHGIRSGIIHNGPLGDIEGLLYFLVSSKIYLDDLKKNYLSDYTLIMEDPNISEAFLTLIQNAFSLLEHGHVRNKICDSEELNDLYRYLLKGYKNFPLGHHMSKNLKGCGDNQSYEDVIIGLENINQASLGMNIDLNNCPKDR
jgi:hypothetical protein